MRAFSLPGPMPLLRAYIDETGDRGHSARSSPFFAFAAVLVADEDEAALRATMLRLRRDLKIPPGKALHWKDHVKTYSRRQYVGNVLSAVPGVIVTYVIVEKAAIPVRSGLRTDHVIFYNYAACLVMERILLAARDWPGGSRDAIVRFGHVRALTTPRQRITSSKRPGCPDGCPGTGCAAASISMIRRSGMGCRQQTNTLAC